jgi:hypothetical protein
MNVNAIVGMAGSSSPIPGEAATLTHENARRLD